VGSVAGAHGRGRLSARRSRCWISAARDGRLRAGRELRTRLGSATPVLIALTGYGQERDQRRSAEAGFAAHLVKPVDAKKLVNLSRRWRSPSRPAREARDLKYPEWSQTATAARSD
jgi:DNA-binding response OmpR family regulator